MLDRHIEWKSSGPDGAGCPAERKCDTRVFPEQTAAQEMGGESHPQRNSLKQKRGGGLGLVALLVFKTSVAPNPC